MKRYLLLACLLLLLTGVFGHEYILMAYHFKLNKGDNLEIHLFVADGFNVQLERPVQNAIIKKFELLTPDSIVNLKNQPDGSLPVVNRRVDFDGGGLIHMERDYAKISLPTDKFFEYLKEDHLDGIAGKTDKKKKEQRERYTRYIKALVQSGHQYTDSLYRTNIGQRFEIILLQNPYQLHKGSIIQAKILFEGKPLAGKIMTARNRTGSKASIVQTSKTNQNGICSFQLPRTGDWFIHGTYMLSCPDKNDADWESFWTSYSFEIE
ncbi:MAG: DUF4198 domain-containing protein [Bacteroidota bacterium]